MSPRSGLLDAGKATRKVASIAMAETTLPADFGEHGIRTSWNSKNQLCYCSALKNDQSLRSFHPESGLCQK